MLRIEQLFGFRDDTTGTGLSASAGWSHSFEPRFNNSANLTFSRNINKNAPFFAYSSERGRRARNHRHLAGPHQLRPAQPLLHQLRQPFRWHGLGRPQPDHQLHRRHHLRGARRKHNLTFGFSIAAIAAEQPTYQNARGSFSFSGLLTSELRRQRPAACTGTGFDFADFLLGLPQSSSLRFGNDNNYFRSWATSGYAQDDWRICRGLSFNIGLRYEYFAPYTELYGHLANLDLEPGFTAAAVVDAGHDRPLFRQRCPSSLVRPDANNFSPRFGFA